MKNTSSECNLNVQRMPLRSQATQINNCSEMRLGEHYSEFHVKEDKKWTQPTLFMKWKIQSERLPECSANDDPRLKPLDPTNHPGTADFKIHSRAAPPKKREYLITQKSNNSPEQQKISSKSVKQFLHSYVYIVLICSQEFIKNSILLNWSRTNCPKTITKTRSTYNFGNYHLLFWVEHNY